MTKQERQDLQAMYQDHTFWPGALSMYIELEHERWHTLSIEDIMDLYELDEEAAKKTYRFFELREKEKKFEKTRLGKAIKLVTSGESKIFKNWHEFTGVSMEDFIEALEWLYTSELPTGQYDRHRLRFELGCTRKGELVKLRRSFEGRDHSLTVFRRIGDGSLWDRSYPSISAVDSL